MDVLLRLLRLQTPLLGHLDLLLSAVLPGLVPAVLFVGLNVTLFRSCYKVIYTKLTSQHFSSGYFLQCSLGSDQHRCLGTSTQVSCGSSQQESTANRTCQCMTSTERVFTWSLLALLDGLPPTLLGVLALLVVGRMRRMGRVRR